jgi:hypothetical protein
MFNSFLFCVNQIIHVPFFLCIASGKHLFCQGVLSTSAIHSASSTSVTRIYLNLLHSDFINLVYSSGRFFQSFYIFFLDAFNVITLLLKRVFEAGMSSIMFLKMVIKLSVITTEISSWCDCNIL